MVEVCGIEPQSETRLLPASTCLERLIGFNSGLLNLQSYTERVSMSSSSAETRR